MLIKLPKKNDDDSDADGEDGEVYGDLDGEVLEGTPIDGDLDGAKTVPIGGGKPFRTIQGKVYIIEGDAFVTDDDPKGDEKIDKFGNLLGGELVDAFSLWSY